MADTDARTRSSEHFTEEDWFDFAHQQAAPSVRASLERHLEKGCSRCTQTVRLWRAVLDVADQEAAYRPPDEALRQVKGDFALRRPKRLLERVAEQAALVFDSFRQPMLAGMRASAGAAARQLLYKAGRYTIKLQVEPGAGEERLSIVGQILDDKDPSGGMRDIAVLALRGSKTLDRTVTNPLGEFHLEPATSGKLQLSVDVPEIGTFTVEPPRRTAKREAGTAADGKAAEKTGRGKKARLR